MNNRMYNAKNPYQGEEKKVLCVCSAGLLRSPTFAHMLLSEYGYNTRACGADVGHALVPIDKVLVHWADEIVVMDKEQQKQVEALLEELDEDKDILVANLPDKYGYGDPELYNLCIKIYDDYLMLKEYS